MYDVESGNPPVSVSICSLRDPEPKTSTYNLNARKGKGPKPEPEKVDQRDMKPPSPGYDSL